MAESKTGGTDRNPLEAVLIPFGVLFVAAAVAGAAVKGAGFELPAVGSVGRQLLAAVVGVVLIAAGTASRWWPPVAEGLQRQIAPRQPSAEVGVVPDPSPHFVGREAELQNLRNRLQTSNWVALSGLGGIGKTQMAIQYAHLNRTDYSRIFWLRGENVTTLTSDFASLAWLLNLPEHQQRDQELVIEGVIRWLRLPEHGRWLLVVDNLGEKVTEELERRLPPGLPGHVLVTSRRPIWEVRLALHPLPMDVAAGFLLDRTEQKDTAGAEAVAEKLGRLPLALEQASAYIVQTGERLARYAQLLDESPGQLLAEGRVGRYPLPVARTWAVSFDRVEKTSSAAAELLRLCAFLAPDAIPLDLLETGAAELNPKSQLRAAAVNRLKLNRILSVLLDYSLASRQDDMLGVHRLVQAVIRESLPAARRRQWAGTAVRILAQAFPLESREVASWTACQRLLPHALAAAEHATQQQDEDLSTSLLLNRVAGYLHARTEFAAARPLYERALELRERVLGPDHPQTASSLDNLAWLLRDQGNLATARPLFERAFEIWERVLGADHPHTAASLNNLAGLLRDQGEFAAARPLFERVVEIWERGLGPDHRHTAASLNNLAGLLRDQGELAAARPLFERAVEIWERALGPDHPDTAGGLNNLALLLRDQGEFAAARPLFERAVEIWERALGPDHPQTGGGLNNLALLLHDQGQFAAAWRLYEHAFKIWKRVLGPDHPHTASSLNNLALLLRDGGEFDAAWPLYERSLEIRERVLGPDHPDTATSLNNLALLLRDQGDLGTARPLLERALEIRARVLGAHHPHTARSLNNLALLLRDQGEFSAARPHLERALEICERVLGPDHPDTAQSLNNLALLLQVQGELTTAQLLCQRALEISERVLGPDHPHTAIVRANLGSLATHSNSSQMGSP
jgi:tetratricopeptide (TPR) repeat protein